MSLMPAGKFYVVADQSTEAVFTEISFDLDVRNKVDETSGEVDKQSEEYRWLVTVGMQCLHSNISSISVLNETVVSTTKLTGSFNGSTADVIAELSGNFITNNRSGFVLSHTSLRPVEAEGSQFVLEEQRYTTTTDSYTAAPWNAS